MIGDLSPLAAGVFLASAAGVVLVGGPRMAAVADRVADVTGLQEAFVGAVLVGIATSLPDLLATVTPAFRGLPELAVGNALGGVLDVPDEPRRGGSDLRGLAARFVVYGLALATAGYVLGRSGEALVAGTGMSETAVGVLLTGLSSSHGRPRRRRGRIGSESAAVLLLYAFGVVLAV